MRLPSHERGAALLAVLMLVGVMAAIAATMLERSRMATNLASNMLARERAGMLVQLAETLAINRLEALLMQADGRPRDGAWQGQPVLLPLPGGSASVVPRDGGNCFNLNSLVSQTGPEALVTRPLGVGQLVALMRMLDVPEPKARLVAAATADWIDSDQQPAALGAEDARYAGAYLTAGTLMAEPSEWRAVTGMEAGLYARLRPWVCALPLAELSPININTLMPAQAPLLAMLMPETMGAPPVRLRLAQQVLAERPRGGWAAVADFANAPLLRDTPIPTEALQQMVVRSDWFSLAMEVRTGARPMRASVLVDARQRPARVAMRQWTGES